MPRTADKERDQIIIDRYKNGELVLTIATSLGLSTAGIHKVIRRHNVPRRDTPPLNEEQIQEIIRRYRADESMSAIIAACSVSKGTLYNVLRRAGINTQRRMGKASPEQEIDIVHRYQAGESPDILAIEFKIDRMTVYNILKRQGASARNPTTVLDETQRDVVAEMCLGGAAIESVADEFNIGKSTVNNILRERGVNLKTGRPRTCRLDETVFDELTPESLYWMGFLFADGCVHRNRDGEASLVCGLGIKDLDHLEKLRAFCKSTHKIRHYTAKAGDKGGIVVHDRDHVYWRVRSNKLCDALERRGIVTKRTRVPVPELAESRDFWRGCVDGDGSIGTTVIRNQTYPHIRLYGQAMLLETFKQFLIDQKIGNFNLSPTASGIWAIQTTGSKAMTIIDALYDKAAIALDRKNERAQTILLNRGHLEQLPSYEEKPARVSIDSRAGLD